MVVSGTVTLTALTTAFNESSINATISGSGSYLDLYASTTSQSLISDLSASISANVVYVTTIFPISTLMCSDVYASIGMLCCEGGSTYADLEASYNLLSTSDLNAEAGIIRILVSETVGASVGTLPRVLDVISLEIYPTTVTYRSGAKVLDSISISISPDRYFDLTASINPILPASDLTAYAKAVRPPIYREDRVIFDGAASPPRAKLNEKLVSEIEYVDVENPEFKRTVQLKFYGGDVEFFYRSISSTISRLSDNKWKVKAVSFEKTDSFEDIDNQRFRYLVDISKFSTVDAAIKDVISSVVGNVKVDISAEATPCGGFLDLTSSAIPTRLDQQSSLTAEAVPIP
jgi:hypothetical protein